MVYQNESIRLKATLKDWNDTVADPDTLSLKIYNPSGTLVITKAKTDMSNPSTGVYLLYYDLPVDAPTGVWSAKWLATTGLYDKPEIIRFEVLPF